jgi:hypothetical protein
MDYSFDGFDLARNTLGGVAAVAVLVQTRVRHRHLLSRAFSIFGNSFLPVFSWRSYHNFLRTTRSMRDL